VILPHYVNQNAFGEGSAGGVVLTCRSVKRTPAHESASRASVASRLAVLKGYTFGGEYRSNGSDARPRYFVPGETLVGTERARQMGIMNEADFFGGLVPQAFMATKAITHPLVKRAAAVPEGWPDNFAALVRDVVLFGFAAFTTEDARLACREVLKRGTARLKPGLGVGGRGQKVLSTLKEVNRALDSLDAAELATHGLAIEENLQNVKTYSVGIVRFEEMEISYCGTQRITRDHWNENVYGGSDLLVIRGDFERLVQLNIPAEMRSAVEKARIYDAAALTELPGFLASRRNYDVAAGIDDRGCRHLGVLEQSWRIGGASPAEVAALEAFRENPYLRHVRASCAEIYDSQHQPPPQACVSFSGEDPEVGYLVKYSLVEKYDDT
jgi:hypothetical protein